MATANLPSYKTHFHFTYCSTPNLHKPKFALSGNPNPNFVISTVKVRLSNTRNRHGICCARDMETTLSFSEEIQSHQFDINLAVILAGFAFEAYTTPTVSHLSFK